MSKKKNFLYTFGCTRCPNDTFCFEQLFDNMHVQCFFSDIETLNRQAFFRKGFDVMKISAGCFPFVREEYDLLPYGAAFAMKEGPQWISKNIYRLSEAIRFPMALPGMFTSAFASLRILFSAPKNAVFLDSFRCRKALLSDEVQSALIIHEPVVKPPFYTICDMGKLYKDIFSELLPLGIIVIRKGLSLTLRTMIEEDVFSSIQMAWNRMTASSFMEQQSDSFEKNSLMEYVKAYVSEETRMLTAEGRRYIETFCTRIGRV